jgi:hypothetical protein
LNHPLLTFDLWEGSSFCSSRGNHSGKNSY